VPCVSSTRRFASTPRGRPLAELDFALIYLSGFRERRITAETCYLVRTRPSRSCQVFHAIRRCQKPVYGMPTTRMFGSRANDLLRTSQEEADYLVVRLDGRGGPFRNECYGGIQGPTAEAPGRPWT